MIRFARFLVPFLSLVTLTIGLSWTPAQAAARPARTPSNGIQIEYVNTLSSDWPVGGAVADIDWYTGSYWTKSNRCHVGTRCIQILKGSVHTKSSDPYGRFMSCRPASEPCKIYVDVTAAKKNSKYNAATKRYLIRHELGHYRMLGHNAKCVSTMWQYNRCNDGSVPPYAFTTAEQATLRAN
jgi:hypothetical protein